jgi:hypothetical protein
MKFSRYWWVRRGGEDTQNGGQSLLFALTDFNNCQPQVCKGVFRQALSVHHEKEYKLVHIGGAVW